MSPASGLQVLDRDHHVLHLCVYIYIYICEERDLYVYKYVVVPPSNAFLGPATGPGRSPAVQPLLNALVSAELAQVRIPNRKKRGFEWTLKRKRAE